MSYEDYIMKNFFILAIGPHYKENHQSYLEIMERKIPSTRTVKKQMDRYCVLFGSSLDGRKKSSRQKFRDVKNPSILVSELHAIAGYQVPSSDRLDKYWIFDLWNATIESLAKNESEILLSNGSKIYTPLPSNLVEKRRDKTWRLLPTSPFFYFPGRQNAYLINESKDDYKI